MDDGLNFIHPSPNHSGPSAHRSGNLKVKREEHLSHDAIIYATCLYWSVFHSQSSISLTIESKYL